jgi:hypothetical protein
MRLARREIIEVTCDICGAVVDSAVVAPNRGFGVDGQRYVIDLCGLHRAEFDDALARFVSSARTAAGRPARAPARRVRSRSVSRTGDPKAIRAWARSNGFATISDRGRVPGAILDAWRASQNRAPASNGAQVRATKKKGGPGKTPSRKKASARKVSVAKKATAATG